MAISKIGSKAITDCTVVAADIAPGTITNAKLAGSIANDRLANSTVTINGTAIALGASGSIPAVSWQSVVVSDGSTVTTMVAGRGYFVDNTSAVGLVKLPISASAGDTIAIKDYAGNFGTNNLTIQRNGHKIQGVANDSEITTNRASVTLVYIDATKGWLYTNESNVADLEANLFIEATGGTVTTSGDYKIHTFTGDGCFVVSQTGQGTSAVPSIVDYLVVAGSGGGGFDRGGGGGGGGYRESKAAASPTHTASPHTASPLAATTGITVTATTYPITVGGGGAAGSSPPNVPGGTGSNSVFSTITSAGGGGGATSNIPSPAAAGKGQVGGSGGGGTGSGPCQGSNSGAGNTPPVSPPQGNPGGPGFDTCRTAGGGGGGAGNAGLGAAATQGAGDGGIGVSTGINGSTTKYSGGGGGGNTPSGPQGGGDQGVGGIHPGGSSSDPQADRFGAGNGGPSATAGAANTGGGGGGGGGCSPYVGAAGAKGIVIIRYKYQ